MVVEMISVRVYIGSGDIYFLREAVGRNSENTELA